MLSLNFVKIGPVDQKLNGKLTDSMIIAGSCFSPVEKEVTQNVL
jgi:hypothetical protein